MIKQRKCKHVLDDHVCGNTFVGSSNFCAKCTILRKKERDKNNKEKRKERLIKVREKKRMSMDNLQKLYQQFVRLVTPDTCSSCGQITSKQGSNQKQGGHLHPKGVSKSTALLVANIYSQCASCNGFKGGMPIDLYQYGSKFWGEETMTQIHKMSKVPYSFDLGERREMFEYITSKINEANKLTSNSSKELLLREVFNWQKEQLWFKTIYNGTI